jgi:hypothetical protein
MSGNLAILQFYGNPGPIFPTPKEKDWAIIKFETFSFRGINSINKATLLSTKDMMNSYWTYISPTLAVVFTDRGYSLYNFGSHKLPPNNFVLLQYANLTISESLNVVYLNTESGVLNTVFTGSNYGFTQEGDSGAPVLFCTSNANCKLIGIIISGNTEEPGRPFTFTLPTWIFYSTLSRLY